MTGVAAVGVDDDLAAGQAHVAHRATDDEAPCGVDVQLVVAGVDVVLRQDRVDDVLLDVVRELVLQIDALLVLRRDHDGLDPDGHVVVVVLDRDLGLAVGTQVRQRAVLAHRGELLGQTVRDRDRQRHELGGLVDREAEHQALVAGTLQVERIGGTADAGLLGGVDALRDVGRLRVQRDLHAAGIAVEALDGRVVANLEHAVTGDARDVGVGLSRDLATDDDQTRRDEGLGRDAALGILGQKSVEDAVADLVGDLVRVTLGHGLGREKSAHNAPGRG